MSENSNIEWTVHTFNPWIGCTKVSEGCKNCYAEAQDKFRSWTPEGWGKGKPRRRTSEANWRKPRAWNARAAADGVRCKVFCASLADWLDDEVPIEWLADLLQVIEETPWLDWQLLTKRPENFSERIERALCHVHGLDYEDQSWVEAELLDVPLAHMINEWTGGGAPKNVWIGTSVENQAMAKGRITALLKIPAEVRFLSCEPLLAPVELTGLVSGLMIQDGQYARQTRISDDSQIEPDVDWVIAGGESGSLARPMDAVWARSLRDQCAAAGIAFFMKQMGGKRKPFPEIPDDLMVREFPDVEDAVCPRDTDGDGDCYLCARLGGCAAYRKLHVVKGDLDA